MTKEFEILIEYIREETGFVGTLGVDDDLLKTGVLDSFSIITLAMFAQERFEVEFDGDDLTRENLARLSNLVALIQLRRSSIA